MFDETYNPDPVWEETKKNQQPTCSGDYDPPLTDEEYKALAEYFGACGEEMPETDEGIAEVSNSVDPTIPKDEHKYDYSDRKMPEEKEEETESECKARLERDAKQRLCQHKNKYINDIGKLRFWVCPDCKKDLGDVR